MYKRACIIAMLTMTCWACDGGSSSGDTRTFSAGGHNCTQQHFPPTPTCDGPAPAVTCTSGTTPCWDIGLGYPNGISDGGTPNPPAITALCPSCCTDHGSTSFAQSCIFPIACHTVTDCPFNSTQCMNGICQ